MAFVVGAGLTRARRRDRPLRARNRRLQCLASEGRFYFNFTGFPFPLRPQLSRETLRYELVPDTIWTFEQEHGLGFTNVATNIRMTVVRLSTGELWVHAPIAPTHECITMLRELGGPVAYIVLPTFAYEHKVFVGPFSRRFPEAQLFVAPELWSWPIRLPNQFFGIFRAKELSQDSSNHPWHPEIDTALLGPVSLGIFPYVEAAFFHRSSRSLIVTDSLVLIPSRPPDVLSPSALQSYSSPSNPVIRICKGARPSPDDPPPSPPPGVASLTTTAWMRIALLVLYFSPFDLIDPRPSFGAISNRLIVAPVVRILVFPSISEAVLAWRDALCLWDFTQIIPAHFAAPVAATPRDVCCAFDFLEAISDDDEAGTPPVFVEEDRRALDQIASLLQRFGIVDSPPWAETTKDN
eukprot:Plantae.Rhodophyta-Rhodochaete_pulchella.ctg3931.p1 GENE.Plantae.Rhodophyta-Rhodochaete_pulchella.ctg3931~~Plantae.Rhodophyta-Rhodochaete_pulchella.ctg3931.p1  ORF type:complete len:424 (-),score=36.67 Plantae.Rhodophyta-Rhodochaete_pulchella.ctg3931:1717-2940(-)